MENLEIVKKVLIICVLVALSTGCVAQRARMNQESATGEEIYRSNCQKCHKLIPPGAYTKMEWNGYIKKYGRKARLNSVEKRKVLEYLMSE